MTDLFLTLMQSAAEWPLGVLIVLALVFLVTAFIPVPRTFLCIGSGVLFGMVSILVILPATTLGCVLAFLAARYLFADRVRRMAAKRPLAWSFVEAVDAEGWRVVALLRFASPVPTFMQNYFFGLTRIALAQYTIASFVFTIPQVCLYVYLGAIGRAALLSETRSTLSLVLMSVAGLSFLIALVLVMRRAARALKARNAFAEPDLKR